MEDTLERWPSEGYIAGDINFLADVIEHTSLSARRLWEGTNLLEQTVRQSAGLLTGDRNEYVRRELGNVLRQEPGEQTTRMAIAILANAVIFHKRLARLRPDEVPDIVTCKTGLDIYLKSRVLASWRQILQINYWPIFALAHDLLEILPDSETNVIVARLEDMASSLQNFGAIDVHDLSGRMFQQLIADREFLATYYTLPASAMLLGELAISRLRVDWNDHSQISRLRVGDFACGTGALLGAACHAISSRYRRASGYDGDLHACMMEEVMVGMDIMPAAVHLTAATLSGMHPERDYENTELVTIPYGKTEHGYRVGSLDLIMDDYAPDVLGTGRTGLSSKQAVQEDRETGRRIEVPHKSMDVVIMNPPFTRDVGVEGEKEGTWLPSLAAFGTTEEDREKMRVRRNSIQKELRKALRKTNHQERPAWHGNVGNPTYFMDLAHAKIRHGGIMALVLPATFVAGKDWKNARELIRRHYEDIMVVSIWTTGQRARAFSADTGMAEILLIATRKKFYTANSEHRDERGEGWVHRLENILAVNLNERPGGQLEAAVAARLMEQVRRDPSARAGSIRLTAKHSLGNYFRTRTWSACGVGAGDLVEFMESLTDRNLFLPRMGNPVPVPVCPLGELGQRGVYALDITGWNKERDGTTTPRGPFDLAPLTPAPAFPILWGHDARRETRLIVSPDRQCVPKEGCRERGVKMWENHASRLHVNINFQLNSQPLAACLTEEISLGGEWPNFTTREEWEIPLVLWANTTIGLISFWWAGTRQQQGRARLTITRHPELITLDPRVITDKQLAQCREILEEFRQKEFKPANEAYHDRTRQELDEAVLVSLLGFDRQILTNLATLRKQWCHEPSVHGGKKTAPPRG